jgi:hypothetical protein
MFDSQQVQDIFLFSIYDHTSSRAHSAAYLMIIRGSFLHVKLLGHEGDHSLPCSTEVKNKWTCIFTPPICLCGTYNFTFNLPFDHFIEIWDLCELHMYTHIHLITETTKKTYSELSCQNSYTCERPLIYIKIHLPIFLHLAPRTDLL